ncbi:MAG: diaminopimelate decarboxylase [Prolixibacteraceae bacterium]|jgi:diaminopimelate decarboxylase|nr:diaminopimelate decarboxylase [Prolixibacteraceae bacterium]
MIQPKYINHFKALETPFYFYDLELLRETLQAVKAESSKYGYHVHYALKANNDEAVVKTIANAGFGADCVSGNEVKYVNDIGIPGKMIAFAGVGKTDKEIKEALEIGIFSFNCESIPEIEAINELAGEFGKVAPVAIRINPNVDAKTHKYITTGLSDNKFGINHWDFDKVGRALKSLPNIKLTGIHFHVGSQITDISVFEKLSLKVNKIQDWFSNNGFELEHINLGGGLGIDYKNPQENMIPDFSRYFKAVHDNIILKPNQQLHFELGRSLVAQCGHLVTKVIFLKKGVEKQFLIVDAGMNDLIRPSLYQALHEISSLTSNKQEEKYDVVGPICESADVFRKDIMLPAVDRGDLIAIHSAGAYCQVMASTYNMRNLIKSFNSDELSR